MTHDGDAKAPERPSGLHRALLYAPLIGHVIPTLIIGFGFVIPGILIEGVDAYTIGFLSAVLGFIAAYVAGIAIARRIWERPKAPPT